MSPALSRRLLTAVTVLAAALLIVVAFMRDECSQGPARRTVTPVVMGTTARLVAVGDSGKLDGALAAARARIDRVNRLMSTYDPASELSRFNRGELSVDDLSPETRVVAAYAEELAWHTGGAFDATVFGLVRLWSDAGKAGSLPTEAEIAEARGNFHLRFLPTAPLVPTVPVTFDAIAKGYAVDQAVEAFKTAGLAGGLVELGGDLRCFDRTGRPDQYRVDVQDPWREGAVVMTLGLGCGSELAVCTSGNYRRFVEIDGRRYSHIIDPRTGRPADAVPSVTVIAPTAMIADGWATAVSVLGVADGLRLIEAAPDVEAMLITGTPDAPVFHYSSGFRKYVVE